MTVDLNDSAMMCSVDGESNTGFTDCGVVDGSLDSGRLFLLIVQDGASMGGLVEAGSSFLLSYLKNPIFLGLLSH